MNNLEKIGVKLDPYFGFICAYHKDNQPEGCEEYISKKFISDTLDELYSSVYGSNRPEDEGARLVLRKLKNKINSL